MHDDALTALLPHFPNVAGHFLGVRRAQTAQPDYNCIAWAAGKDDAPWWPPGGVAGTGFAKVSYWPPGIPTDEVLQSFVRLFESLGYRPCDDVREPDAEKIAIYTTLGGKPTHAARQLESGAWTSKLGQSIVIEHDTPAAVEGPLYDIVAQIMKRPRLPS